MSNEDDASRVRSVDAVLADMGNELARHAERMLELHEELGNSHIQALADEYSAGQDQKMHDVAQKLGLEVVMDVMPSAREPESSEAGPNAGEVRSAGDLTIDDLNVSNRVRESLRAGGIILINELIRLTPEELHKRAYRFGDLARSEVSMALRMQYGLDIRGREDDAVSGSVGS